MKVGQVKSFFYQIIPYAQQLKSLNVKINFRKYGDLLDPEFMLSFEDTPKMEELCIMLNVNKVNVVLKDSILEKMISGSPNLRNVTLS